MMVQNMKLEDQEALNESLVNFEASSTTTNSINHHPINKPSLARSLRKHASDVADRDAKNKVHRSFSMVTKYEKNSRTQRVEPTQQYVVYPEEEEDNHEMDATVPHDRMMVSDALEKRQRSFLDTSDSSSVSSASFTRKLFLFFVWESMKCDFFCVLMKKYFNQK